VRKPIKALGVAPKASLLWLNHNSAPILDIVLKSLESLFIIDYPNYEVVIIDNGSDDGSMQVIEDFIGKAKSQMYLPPMKLVKNNWNLGYTGGNYIGYRHRAKDSKYVIVVNNDLVVEPHSLKSLICYLENHASAAAVQGKITSWDGSKIDNCGFYLDSMYRVHARYNGLPPTEGTKEAVVSYVSGCYSAYRVDAIEEFGGLFSYILPYFGYFDDADTGLRLWKKGYSVRFVPVLAGQHKGGPSYSHPLKNYLDMRNRLASIFNMGGTRRFMVIPWIVYILSRIPPYLGLSVLRDGEYKTRAKYAVLALVNSLSLARRTPKIEGDTQEPCIKLRFPSLVKMTFLPSRVAATVSLLVNAKGTYNIRV